MLTSLLPSRHPFAAGLAAIISVASMPTAHAASFGTGCYFNTQVIADGADAIANTGEGCLGDLIQQRGTVVDQRWTGDEYVMQDFDQLARTGVAGSAGLGVLHAYSGSFAQSTPMAKLFYYANGEPGIIENMARAEARSSLSSFWFDEITVQSAPVYGRVVLRFTITAHGKTSVLETTQGLASFDTRLIADDDRYADDLRLNVNGAGTASDDRGYWPGTKIRIYGELTARSSAYAGRVYGWPHNPLGYIAESNSVADASNTAGFQIEVLTPGASYTSASGRSYVAMVPEPETYALAAAGLALISVFRPGRQRRTERHPSDTAA